jgi:hypothetical protein
MLCIYCGRKCKSVWSHGDVDVYECPDHNCGAMYCKKCKKRLDWECKCDKKKDSK